MRPVTVMEWHDMSIVTWPDVIRFQCAALVSPHFPRFGIVRVDERLAGGPRGQYENCDVAMVMWL